MACERTLLKKKKLGSVADEVQNVTIVVSDERSLSERDSAKSTLGQQTNEAKDVYWAWQQWFSKSAS